MIGVLAWGLRGTGRSMGFVFWDVLIGDIAFWHCAESTLLSADTEGRAQKCSGLLIPDIDLSECRRH